MFSSNLSAYTSSSCSEHLVSASPSRYKKPFLKLRMIRAMKSMHVREVIAPQTFAHKNQQVTCHSADLTAPTMLIMFPRYWGSGTSLIPTIVTVAFWAQSTLSLYLREKDLRVHKQT